MKDEEYVEPFAGQGGRDPWAPNPPRDWAALPVPLTAEQLQEAGRTVRTFQRGNPKMVTYERRLRIVCDIALKLLEHNDCFDEVER